MALLRAAFEGVDGVVRIVVLCAGCFQEMLARKPAGGVWSAKVTGTHCEFCMDEASRQAL